MSDKNTVLLRIRPVWEPNNTFEKVDKLVNGAKNKVNELNNSCNNLKKSTGQLKEKIAEWRSEQEKTLRTDHYKKYEKLIDGAKKKVKELEDSAKSCGEKTQSIFKSVFNADLLMRGLVTAKNAIVSFSNDSMAAYQRHNVAKTQLMQVMKNTMGVGKWDTDDIVDLTKAQQKLGVVSSSVQLSGAKELATYLKKKESLEALIPTMNNMLTHQFGLNATQENAYGIAQMMGKVMEGQTQALSRNGYWFTEAQEKILKYGAESERAATLMEVVEQSVQKVNEALAATPEGKAKQLSMEYEDLKIKAGETLTKLKVGVMSYTYEHRKGLLTLAKAVGVLTAGIIVNIAVTKGWKAISEGCCTLTKAWAVAKSLLTGKVKQATASFVAFNAVTKANIIGAIVGILMAAGTAFALFRKRNNEATDSMKQARETYSSFYAQERRQLDEIFAKLKQTNPKSNERKRLVKELAELYPDLNKQTLDDITNTNNLSAAYNTLIGVIQKRARATALNKALDEIYSSDGYLDLEDAYRNDKLGIIKNYANKSDGGVFTYQMPLSTLSGREYKPSEVRAFLAKKSQADAITGELANLSSGSQSNYSGGNSNNTNSYSSTASDSITGGGKQVKNFYINIDSLIRENTNMFQSSKDDPASAQDFMGKLSEALQSVVNDVNYAAA